MELDRRQFMRASGGGFGSLAMAGMLGRITRKARAKHVIFLFMYGGPSQVDTFDYKPKLYGLDGKTIDVPTFGRQGKRPGAASSGPSGSSNSTASAASTSPTCSPASPRKSTRSLSCTRCTPRAPSTARRCST